MFGPGEYVADQTEGITRVEDLPKPKLVRRRHNYKRRPCPLCQHNAYRLRTVTRTLRTIMDEVYRLFDRRCRMDTALEKLEFCNFVIPAIAVFKAQD